MAKARWDSIYTDISMIRRVKFPVLQDLHSPLPQRDQKPGNLLQLLFLTQEKHTQFRMALDPCCELQSQRNLEDCIDKMLMMWYSTAELVIYCDGLHR